MVLSDPLVIAAHEAAEGLIRTTETTDLIGAYAVVDAHVRRMN